MQHLFKLISIPKKIKSKYVITQCLRYHAQETK
jgi:hypothetical protein